jgi:hypothetical protein
MSQKWWILIGILALVGVLVLTSNHKQREKTVPSFMKTHTPANVTTTSVAEDAWLIEPGIRVGPITAKSSLSDLQKSFGTPNVHQEKIYGAEGETYPGVVIYPNDPKKRLEIIWKSPAPKGETLPGSILIRPGNADTEQFESLWHTANGVTLGTPLKNLETLNGGPFTLAGFDWDYGGIVLSWGDQGKLKDAFQQKGLVLRLGPAKSPPAKAMDAVEGDARFSSDNPNMQAVKPFVQEITVILH